MTADTARAQQGDATPRVLSLAEALVQARSQFASVRVSRATEQRVRAEQRLVRGEALPSLSAEAGLGVGYVNQPYSPGFPRYESGALSSTAAVTLDWVALDFARAQRMEAAGHRTRAQAQTVRDSEQQAMHFAAERYVQAVAASELVSDARLTIERRSQQNAAIAALVESGLRPAIDSQRTEIDLLSARHALQVAQIDEQAAFSALATSVGGPPASLVRPAGFDDAVLPQARPPGQAGQTALARPELRALDAERAAQQAQYRADARQWWPQLGLQVSGSASRRDVIEGDGLQGDFYNAAAGVYLRWRAFDPDVWLKPSVSAAASVEAAAQLFALRLDVQAQAVAASHEVQRRAASLAQAVDVLAAAERARSVQSDRYQSGIASLLELLDAETLEQNARRQRIEALRDHRLARVRLLAAGGEIERLAR